MAPVGGFVGAFCLRLDGQRRFAFNHSVRGEQGVEAHGQHTGKHRCAAVAGCAVTALSEPWVQQRGQQANDQERGQTRHHRPEREAHFPQCPHDGCHKHNANHQRGGGLCAYIQHAAYQQAETCQQVVPGAAQCDQLSAHDCQEQAA